MNISVSVYKLNFEYEKLPSMTIPILNSLSKISKAAESLYTPGTYNINKVYSIETITTIKQSNAFTTEPRTIL